MESNGVLTAVQDGTAIGYLLLAKLVQMLLQVAPLQALRILSFISYLGICIIILSYLSAKFIEENKQAHTLNVSLIILVFTAYAKIWLFRGYADLTAAFFFLWVLKLAIQSSNLSREKGKLLWMGFLAFVACTIRPTSLIMLLSLGVCYTVWCIFRKQIEWRVGLYFSVSFLIGMSIYLLPSYLKYGHVRMENKELVVVNGEKEMLPGRSWSDLNYYSVLYPQVHKKPNKWAITHEEVAQFKADNPGSLPHSLFQFVREYPWVWFRTTLYKVTMQSYFYICNGFFLTKWTSIIKYVPLSARTVQNISGFFTFLVFLFLWWRNRSSVKVGIILLWSFVYIAGVSAYSVEQLEQNWMLVPNLIVSAVFVLMIFSKISNFYLQCLVLLLQSAFLILVL
ncbi:MAG: hypothetical protein KIT56_08375 [Gammaproteobacteria bacterium]|nr:hypothetical protein [Gammaproteobacteria bacterium]